MSTKIKINFTLTVLLNMLFSRFFLEQDIATNKTLLGWFSQTTMQKTVHNIYMLLKKLKRKTQTGYSKEANKSLSRTKQESPLFNTKRLRSIEWGIITNTKCSSPLFLQRRNSRALRFLCLSSARVLAPLPTVRYSLRFPNPTLRSRPIRFRCVELSET